MYHYECWFFLCKFVKLVFIINYNSADVDPVPLTVFLAILELDIAPLNIFERNIGAKQNVKLCFAYFFVVLGY